MEPESWQDSIDAENYARAWLWCRLIGGPRAGEVLGIQNNQSVIHVVNDGPVWNEPPINKSGQAMKPPAKVKQTAYYRTGWNPCYFEAES